MVSWKTSTLGVIGGWNLKLKMSETICHQLIQKLKRLLSNKWMKQSMLNCVFFLKYSLKNLVASKSLEFPFLLLLSNGVWIDKSYKSSLTIMLRWIQFCQCTQNITCTHIPFQANVFDSTCCHDGFQSINPSVLSSYPGLKVLWANTVLGQGKQNSSFH